MRRWLMFWMGMLCSALFTTLGYSDWVFVDLKPYANSKIIDTQWWTGNAGASDLEEAVAASAAGQKFDGPGGEKVPFQVEDANLRLFGTNVPANPKEITGIVVGATAEAVYFLHMTGWQAPGQPSYKFVMNYQDGSSEELMMETHVNSDDWCHVANNELADPNSAWAWQEAGVTCGLVGLIATKWENPHPAKRIETIDVVSLETAAVPGVFGITLGGASLAVSPGNKLALTWGELKSP